MDNDYLLEILIRDRKVTKVNVKKHYVEVTLDNGCVLTASKLISVPFNEIRESGPPIGS